MNAGHRIGSYEILSQLGAGGMGEVWRARDTRLGRNVAIKVLPQEFAKDENRLLRFEQEARTLAALNHPNVLAIYDTGLHEGTPYLVSELLEGRTLREDVEHGALSQHKAVDYALQVAHGLAAAHAKGIVHRDLKPENIFVTKDGRVKVLDFGLAKTLRRPSDVNVDAATLVQPQQTTQPGAVMGTPSYMSPEQVSGQEVDHRADLFAFGAILYEMLSGKRAFRRNTSVETMNAILNEEPAELIQANPNIPVALNRIVQRCLEKNLDRRFQSASDLCFALEPSSTEGTADRGDRSPSAGKPLPDAGTRTRWRAALGFAVLLLVALAVFLFLKFRPQSGRSTVPQASTPVAKRITSLAVKPLDDFSGDTNNAYLSDGMTEALCAALGNVSALRVPGRSSVMRFKGGQKSISEMAKELNVEAVVEGSIQRAGTRIMITVQLIDAATDRHLWATNYQRDLSDFFTVQSEVARAIASEVQARLTPEDQARLARAHPANRDAVEAYLKGRQHWNKRNPDDLLKGIEYFERAIQSDPNYAPAYVGLADCTWAQVAYAGVRPRVALPKVEAYVKKAIALDDTLAEAHASFSSFKFHYDLDWAGAEKECLRAIELNPSYPPAHYWYALLLVAVGREAEAELEYKRALELDPLSAVAHWHAGFINYYLRRYDQAAAAYKRAMEIEPTYGGAERNLRSAESQIKIETQALSIMARQPADRPISKAAALIEANKVLGLADLARLRLKLKLDQTKDNAYVNPFEIAEAFCVVGDKAQALVYLNRAYEERSNDLFLLRADPALDAVRDEPGFQELLKKMKLDK